MRSERVPQVKTGTLARVFFNVDHLTVRAL